jgi:hypothetical protein
MRFALRFTIAAALVFAFAGSALAQSYSAVLNGIQEVPPNASPATGSASFTLDAAKVLHYNMVFSGLVAAQTAAHIHGPAAPGVNAAVIFPFGLGSPQIGTFGPLTPTQEGWLNGGLLYCNVHTQAFPGGEIRGQILRDTVGTESETISVIKALYR